MTKSELKSKSDDLDKLKSDHATLKSKSEADLQRLGTKNEQLSGELSASRAEVANLKGVNDLLEIETNKTMTLEGELEVKAAAYDRKIQQFEEQFRRSSTNYENKQTAHRTEITRLIRLNEEKIAEINELKDINSNLKATNNARTSNIDKLKQQLNNKD